MINQNAIDEHLVQLSQERLELSRVEKVISGLPQTSAELTLAVRGAQMAKMLLGKAKGYLGAMNPYPDSKNPKNDNISAVANDFEYKGKIPKVDEKGLVSAIKQLRADLDVMIRALSNDATIMPQNKNYQRTIEAAWVAASEASLYLGLELGSIRDSAEAKSKAKKAPAKGKAKGADKKPETDAKKSEDKAPDGKDDKKSDNK